MQFAEDGELGANDVRDRCWEYSTDFLLYLHDWDEKVGAELIYGFQMGDLLGHRVIMNAHVAVRVEDKVYDWTYRQFDPSAPAPKISTVAEFRAEWPVSPN